MDSVAIQDRGCNAKVVTTDRRDVYKLHLLQATACGVCAFFSVSEVESSEVQRACLCSLTACVTL